jgi:hypothetical protein
MNISFCSVVLSLIQGIALNTDVPSCSQDWGVTKLREERDMVFQDNNSISREEY